jgi:TRAP-type C4-dicarboxylate transport system permease large subunit
MTAEIGLDPIQLGIILVYNLLVGTVTPPMGICVFIVSNIAGLKVETVFRACVPFLVPLLILLALVTYVPEITLALPRLLLD